MINISVRGASSFARFLKTRDRSIKSELKKASRQSAQATKKAVVSKVFQPKKVNKQDNPRGEIRPRKARASTKSQNEGFQVSLGGHWIRARSAVVVKLMREFGLQKSLVRKNLIVKRTLFHGIERIEDEEEKIRFRGAEWLKRWAEREDRGAQRLRHAVRAPAELRMRLSLAPGVKQEFGNSLNRFSLAILRGLK